MPIQQQIIWLVLGAYPSCDDEGYPFCYKIYHIHHKYVAHCSGRSANVVSFFGFLQTLFHTANRTPAKKESTNILKHTQ